MSVSKIEAKVSSQQAMEAYRVEMLRISHCLDSPLVEGSKDVSLTQWQRSTPQKHNLSIFDTNFC
jgi:hypothetical protein